MGNGEYGETMAAVVLTVETAKSSAVEDVIFLNLKAWGPIAMGHQLRSLAVMRDHALKVRASAFKILPQSFPSEYPDQTYLSLSEFNACCQNKLVIRDQSRVRSIGDVCSPVSLVEIGLRRRRDA